MVVKIFNNPALHEQPLSQQATAIPLRENESLLNWIENTGRFKLHEPSESMIDKVVEEIEEILETSDFLDKEIDKEEEEWDQTSN